MLKKKIICKNCGCYGHERIKCNEPQTSIGILAFKIEDENDDFLKEMFNNFSKNFNNNIENKIILSKTKPEIKCNYTNMFKFIIDDYDNNSNCNYLKDVKTLINNNFLKKNNINELIELYSKKIKFLMIKRKMSLGFVQFIQGKYQYTNNDSLIKMFESMTQCEINLIKTCTYDELLLYFINGNKIYMDNIIKNKKNSRIYEMAKKEYMKLKNNTNSFNLNFYLNKIKPKWKYEEWGFPKGKRNDENEKNYECALREFQEETSYELNDITIFDKIGPIEEILKGTNDMNYKHIYYIGLINNDKKIDYGSTDVNEIGDVRWLSYNDAIKYIRPYHVEKKNILKKIFTFILYCIILHTKK